MPVRVIGRIAPYTDGAFKVVEAEDLGGLFVKSITAAGLVTYQDANDDEQTGPALRGQRAGSRCGLARRPRRLRLALPVTGIAP